MPDKDPQQTGLKAIPRIQHPDESNSSDVNSGRIEQTSPAGDRNFTSSSDGHHQRNHNQLERFPRPNNEAVLYHDDSGRLEQHGPIGDRSSLMSSRQEQNHQDPITHDRELLTGGPTYDIRMDKICSYATKHVVVALTKCLNYEVPDITNMRRETHLRRLLEHWNHDKNRTIKELVLLLTTAKGDCNSEDGKKSFDEIINLITRPEF